MMSTKELIVRRIEKLPERYLDEVLDFISLIVGNYEKTEDKINFDSLGNFQYIINLIIVDQTNNNHLVGKNSLTTAT